VPSLPTKKKNSKQTYTIITTSNAGTTQLENHLQIYNKTSASERFNLLQKLRKIAHEHASTNG
jgi:hypothetical protein